MRTKLAKYLKIDLQNQCLKDKWLSNEKGLLHLNLHLYGIVLIQLPGLFR